MTVVLVRSARNYARPSAKIVDPMMGIRRRRRRRRRSIELGSVGADICQYVPVPDPRRAVLDQAVADAQAIRVEVTNA